jgi:hypothetical protein
MLDEVAGGWWPMEYGVRMLDEAGGWWLVRRGGWCMAGAGLHETALLWSGGHDALAPRNTRGSLMACAGGAGAGVA